MTREDEEFLQREMFHGITEKYKDPNVLNVRKDSCSANYVNTGTTNNSQINYTLTTSDYSLTNSQVNYYGTIESTGLKAIVFDSKNNIIYLYYLNSAMPIKINGDYNLYVNFSSTINSKKAI